MFTKEYFFNNFNVGFIEKTEDKFNKVFIVQSYHTLLNLEYSPYNAWTDHRYETLKFHRKSYLPLPCNVKLDIQFKSSPEGEKLRLVYRSSPRICDGGYMIVNINGLHNIVLKKDYDIVYPEHDDYHTFFSIDKEEFMKCCAATELSIQIMQNKNVVYTQQECSGMIPVFQAFCNEVFDNTMYPDAKNKVLERINTGFETVVTWAKQHEEKQRQENEKKDKEYALFKTKLIVGVILLIIVGIALGFLLAS